MAVATCVGAQNVEVAIVAAMKLSEKRNYSWTCDVTDDAQSYFIEGKTREDGLTWQRQPMAPVIAKRLGRGAEHELEAIFNGPLHYVIQTEKGWRSLSELPKEHPDWSEGHWYYVTPPLVRTPDQSADASDLDPLGLPTAIYVPVPHADENRGKPYSNAQFALALPHEELSVVVSSHVTMNVEGNTVTGTLSDLGAQLLLVHDGHEYIKPVTAAGRFKLILENGIVKKYSVELAGIVLIDRKPIHVRQRSTTQIKDVGTTRFDVPRAVQARLLGR